MKTKILLSMLEQPVIVGAAQRPGTNILELTLSNGSVLPYDLCTIIQNAIGSMANIAAASIAQTALSRVLVNSASTPKDGNVLTNAGKIYIFAGGAWRQVYPATFAA